MALSKKHLEDSVKYNRRHADDHLKAMKDAQKRLKGKEYFSRINK